MGSFLGAILLFADFHHVRHPSRKRAFSTPISFRREIADPGCKGVNMLLDCTAPMLLNIDIGPNGDIRSIATRLRQKVRDSLKYTAKDLSSLWYPYRLLRFLVQSTMRGKTFKRGIGSTFGGNVESLKNHGVEIVLLGTDLAMREGMTSIYAGAFSTQGRLQVVFSYARPYLSDPSACAIVSSFAEALPVEGEVLLARGPFELARKRGLVARPSVV